MKGLRRPVISVIKSRGYAAQAAIAPTHGEIKVSQVPNGMTIVSMDTVSPLTRLGLFVRAGTRYEDPTNLGITHAMRNCCHLTNKIESGFKVSRHMAQIGATLQVGATHDLMTYVTECTRTGVNESMKYMMMTAITPAFEKHEIQKISDKIKLDLDYYKQSPTAQFMELVHQAAFRGPLANSMYMPDHKVGTHTQEQMLEYVQTKFTTENMVCVGMGVDHYSMEVALQNVKMTKGEVAIPKGIYGGDDLRMNNGLPYVQAAVAAEGVSLSSPDLLTLGVLQHVIGMGPNIKYTYGGAGSRLGKAVATSTEEPFMATGLNISYMDTGIFGFQMVGNAHDMRPMLESAMKVFREIQQGGISEEEVSRAKYQLKSSILMYQEAGADQFENLALQYLNTGKVLSATDSAALVDSITLDQVKSLASKVMGSKLSMAAVGDIAYTPFLDELEKK